MQGCFPQALNQSLLSSLIDIALNIPRIRCYLLVAAYEFAILVSRSWSASSRMGFVQFQKSQHDFSTTFRLVQGFTEEYKHEILPLEDSCVLQMAHMKFPLLVAQSQNPPPTWKG